MSFIIKKAERKDVKVIKEYINKHAKFAKIQERCCIEEKIIESSFFDNQYAIALIGYEDDEPVGIATYYYNFSSITGSRGIFIEDLFIDFDKRGKGYGKKLISKIFAIAKDENIKKVDWYCLKNNTRAIEMYKKIGAIIEEELIVLTMES
jgi:RimJ/RimL family protein N-acetyltransferase